MEGERKRGEDAGRDRGSSERLVPLIRAKEREIQAAEQPGCTGRCRANVTEGKRRKSSPKKEKD